MLRVRLVGMEILRVFKAMDYWRLCLASNHDAPDASTHCFYLYTYNTALSGGCITLKPFYPATLTSNPLPMPDSVCSLAITQLAYGVRSAYLSQNHQPFQITCQTDVLLILQLCPLPVRQ